MLKDIADKICNKMPITINITSDMSGPQVAAETQKAIDTVLKAEDLTVAGKMLSRQIECKHDWKHYNGLMDSFDFCTICDEKRRLV